ncbi:hypothetical protein [Vibrio jasicida]|uniref:hypothetical protein n=1 Tax=Vibrio jasicida TaxID=766224 RepID=UPI0040684606
MKYKQLGWDDYQPYTKASEEIYFTIDNDEHRVGLVNHAVGAYTLRDGVELGEFDIESNGEESYVDRASVEPKRLLAVTKALIDEDMGADLQESFITHYQDLCTITEGLNTQNSSIDTDDYRLEKRPALHLASDKELLTLIRQIKQAQRFGDKEEVSKRASEFIKTLKQRMNGEPKPTGVKELRQIAHIELGIEYETIDNEDRDWLKGNKINESISGQIDVKKRPSIIQSDNAYQSILKNLYQAEVELNKAHHMSSEELIAKTLELVK